MTHLFNKAGVIILLMVFAKYSIAIELNCKNTDISNKRYPEFDVVIGEDDKAVYVDYENGMRRKSSCTSSSIDKCEYYDYHNLVKVQEDAQTIRWKDDYKGYMLKHIMNTYDLNKTTGQLLVTNWEAEIVEYKSNERFKFKKEENKREWRQTQSWKFICH